MRSTLGRINGDRFFKAALAGVFLSACSSASFTADPATSGGAPDNSGAAGQVETGGATSDNGGQAGAIEEQAGAGNDANGGSDTGGGEAQAGTNSGGIGGTVGIGGIGGTVGLGGTVGVAGSPSIGGSGGQPAINKLKASDDFATAASAAGWTITGDVAAESPAVWASTGGNPTGAISWVDGGGSIWYFNAPKKYYGDDSAYYGGELRFDLKVTAITDLYVTTDVLLTSDTVTLAYDCAPDPTTKFTTYKVPLKETGWKVGSLAGAAVTAAQFKTVLASLTRLRIRGEFNTGADTGHLDNVFFGLN